jgi:hypothetical protein
VNDDERADATGRLTGGPDRQNKLEARAIYAVRGRSYLAAMMLDNHAANGQS